MFFIETLTTREGSSFRPCRLRLVYIKVQVILFPLCADMADMADILIIIVIVVVVLVVVGVRILRIKV